MTIGNIAYVGVILSLMALALSGNRKSSTWTDEDGRRWKTGGPSRRGDT